MTAMASISLLTSEDTADLRALNALFADVFEEPHTYRSAPPTEAYLREFLARPHVLVVVARADSEIVGGLVAYQLDKFEQERREIYIYDLAVAETHRRRGIATGLIQTLGREAVARGAYVIYVQADHGDEAAIALYDSLGSREHVLHFDIQPSDVGA